METENTESVLDAFSLLREGNELSQIEACMTVLGHLRKKQSTLDSDDICHELHLGIRRIIRALGSPRSRARKGFYSALMGIMHVFPQITFQILNETINNEFSNYHPEEESDVFKGIILSYGALIQSGTILQANKEEIHSVVAKIVSISKKKSYFLLAVATYLGELLSKIDLEVFKVVWKLLHENFINQKTLVLEAFYLLMIAEKRFQSVINSKYLEKALGSSEIFNDFSFDLLSEKLLCIPHISYMESSVYQYVLNELSSSKTFVRKIWLKIDEYLSAPTALRMVVAFKLFEFFSKKLENKDLLCYAFTPNFILLLGNNNYEEEFEIINARKSAIDCFCKSITLPPRIESKKLISIIDKLYFYPGSFKLYFELGSKVYLALIFGLNEESVKDLAEKFQNVLTDKSMKVIEMKADEEETRPWKVTQKKICILMINRLLNHSSVTSCVQWKVNQLKVLIDIGFFKNGLSNKLSTIARTSFFQALDQKFQRLTELRLFLSGVANYFDEKLCSSDFISVDFNKEARKLWTNMMKIVLSLETDAGKLANTTIHVMFLQFGLSLFKEDKLAAENLKELLNIYKHLNKKTADDDKQLPWTDVITDLILSLLSQGDKFNRHVVAKVFIYLCPYLTAQNIYQMLAVLNPNSKNPLTVLNRDDDEDDDMEGSENEKEGELDEDEDEDEDSSDESESEIEMSGEEAEDDRDYERLRAEVRTALGNDAALTDTESVDLDDLNEEEGRHLDEKLSEAFRSIKQQQQKRGALQEKDLSVFRIKVLDLIEVWTKTEPELDLLLDVISVAFMLLENTLKGSADNELIARLKSFLTKVSQIKKYRLNSNLEPNLLVKLVEKIISREDRTQTVYIAMSDEIIKCCTFIFKVTIKPNSNMEEAHTELCNVYQNLLKEWFHTNNNIIPIGLFPPILNLIWTKSIHLVEEISNIVFDENTQLRTFQKCQALKMLDVYFRNKRQLTDLYISQNKKKLQKIISNVIDKGISELKTNFSDKLFFQFIQTKAAMKMSVHSAMDWQNVENLLREIRMCNLKNGNVARSSEMLPSMMKKNKKKRKLDESAIEGDDDESSKEGVQEEETIVKRQVKKKKKNNRILTRKDIKIRRAKESSKGLDEVFSFSKLQVSNNRLIKR